MPSQFETSDQLANQAEFDLSELATVPFATASGTGAAISLPSLPADATKALVAVEGGTVRWRPDGATTAPTSSAGMPLPTGTTTPFLYGHTALVAVRLYVPGGAVLSVVYGA